MELRGTTVGHPNTWGFFGGKADKKETPLQNIRRELREETGKQFVDFDHVSEMVPDRIWYFIKLVDYEFAPVLSDESSAFQWCDEFPVPLHPMVQLFSPNFVAFLRKARES
jgi:8-oxo-dGTP pyrophosphatase MutT (NUDIX family)